MVENLHIDYISPDSTGSLVISLFSDSYGTDTISVNVTDGFDSITETFVLTVNEPIPENHAPEAINPVVDQVVNAAYELFVDLTGLFEDIDGEMLTLTAFPEGGGNLPSWAELVGDSLIFAPMIADTGCV